MRIKATVETVIRTVFPNGTWWNPDEDGKSAAGTAASFESKYGEMPICPTDVFAVAGTLVEYSGIYHRLKPADLSFCDDAVWEKLSAQLDELRPLQMEQAQNIRISAADIIRAGSKAWCQIGRLWGSRSDYSFLVKPLWSVLIESRSEVVRIANLPKDIVWPGAALALMVISDEACEGVGYFDANWIENIFRRGKDIADVIIDQRYPWHIYSPFEDGSLTVVADDNVVCVMPKSRTASIGCTMRTLTHNLALLPPPHKASAFWLRSPQQVEKNTKPLNLLLVPYPYDIDANDFRGTGTEQSYPPEYDRWGEFVLEQNWLDDEYSIVNEIEAMLFEAKKRGSPIEGVVLPEYALNWKTYVKLLERLRDQERHGHLKFIVSGCSQEPHPSNANPKPVKGNFVLSSVFYETPDNPGLRTAITTSRGKHHRWRLDRSQISGYCLDGVLDANTFWWEDISLPERTVSNVVFRERSVFTTLICEDLARSEPVHSVLQSMGPNLVFVLLMDGPQLQTRWAARNATGLTEDPGSSVLTFTSRGLISRQAERINGFPANFTVALWKDDTQQIQQIECGPDYKAAIVSLSAARAKETTLDGRANSNAWTWRMSGYQLVK